MSDNDLEISEDLVLTEQPTKSQARADFGKLLTIILLKISNASMSGEITQFKSLVELLGIYLCPFEDQIFIDEVKKIDTKIEEEDTTAPHQKSYFTEQGKDQKSLSLHLKALMKLMHRSGLVGVSTLNWSKETAQNEKSDSPTHKAEIKEK